MRISPSTIHSSPAAPKPLHDPASAETFQARRAATHHAPLALPPWACRDPVLREDTERELFAAIYAATPRYAPERGAYSTFCDRVARNAARGLRAARLAEKRNAEIIPHDDSQGHDCLDAASEDRVYLIHIRRDVHRALDQLVDADDRRLCIAVMRHETFTEAAADLELSRAELGRRLRALRPTFERCGLGAYIGRAA